MKTLSDNQQKVVATNSDTLNFQGLDTFSVTLRDGREVTIREMTGKDLVHIEEEFADMGETKRSFHIIELLNLGGDKLSYEDVEALGVKDIKKITELISKANGDDQDEQGKDPK